MSVSWADVSDLMYGIILGRGSSGIKDSEVYRLIRKVKRSADEKRLQIAIVEAGVKLGCSNLIYSTDSYVDERVVTTYFPSEKT
jgi:MinD superfamily P-loop ATPase